MTAITVALAEATATHEPTEDQGYSLILAQRAVETLTHEQLFTQIADVNGSASPDELDIFSLLGQDALKLAAYEHSYSTSAKERNATKLPELSLLFRIRHELYHHHLTDSDFVSSQEFCTMLSLWIKQPRIMSTMTDAQRKEVVEANMYTFAGLTLEELRTISHILRNTVRYAEILLPIFTSLDPALLRINAGASFSDLDQCHRFLSHTVPQMNAHTRDMAWLLTRHFRGLSSVSDPQQNHLNRILIALRGGSVPFINRRQLKRRMAL